MQLYAIRTPVELCVTSPNGRLVFRDRMRIAMPRTVRERNPPTADGASHLNETLRVQTILDAIGFGRLADVFERNRVHAECGDRGRLACGNSGMHIYLCPNI